MYTWDALSVYALSPYTWDALSGTGGGGRSAVRAVRDGRHPSPGRSGVGRRGGWLWMVCVGCGTGECARVEGGARACGEGGRRAVRADGG